MMLIFIPLLLGASALKTTDQRGDPILNRGFCWSWIKENDAKELGKWHVVQKKPLKYPSDPPKDACDIQLAGYGGVNGCCSAWGETVELNLNIDDQVRGLSGDATVEFRLDLNIRQFPLAAPGGERNLAQVTTNRTLSLAQVTSQVAPPGRPRDEEIPHAQHAVPLMERHERLSQRHQQTLSFAWNNGACPACVKTPEYTDATRKKELIKLGRGPKTPSGVCEASMPTWNAGFLSPALADVGNFGKGHFGAYLHQWMQSTGFFFNSRGDTHNQLFSYGFKKDADGNEMANKPVILFKTPPCDMKLSDLSQIWENTDPGANPEGSQSGKYLVTTQARNAGDPSVWISHDVRGDPPLWNERATVGIEFTLPKFEDGIAKFFSADAMLTIVIKDKVDDVNGVVVHKSSWLLRANQLHEDEQ